MVKRRRRAKFRSVISLLTTSVIVATFVYLHREIADDTRRFEVQDGIRRQEKPGVIFDNIDIRGKHRSLLRFKYRRKSLQDKMWLTGPLNKTKTKTSNKNRFDNSDGIVVKLKNIWNENVPEEDSTVSETTPSATNTPTRPITTVSDTTPIYTNAPTQPITTESITTPIVTEAGQKEITTEKSEIT